MVMTGGWCKWHGLTHIIGFTTWTMVNQVLTQYIIWVISEFATDNGVHFDMIVVFRSYVKWPEASYPKFPELFRLVNQYSQDIRLGIFQHRWGGSEMSFDESLMNKLWTLSGWWFGTWILFFPSYWERHNPIWRTPSFFRGVGLKTTNQLWFFFGPKVLFTFHGHSGVPLGIPWGCQIWGWWGGEPQLVSLTPVPQLRQNI